VRRALAASIVAVCLLAGACSSDGDSASPTTEPTESTTATTSVPPADVTVEGPISGGDYGVPYNPAPPSLLEDAGYREDEYFVSGRAESFTTDVPLSGDGSWTLQPAGEADYTTRIVVRRPDDPEAFNGKVLVEWLNVSAGRDSDPDWGFLHPYLTREGWAYVGVSAQAVGVEGGSSRLEVPGVPPEALMPLKDWDPVRYAPLSHPGDAWSYGIYSDVSRLLRAPGEVDPLGGLRPDTVVAIGESQSAGRMATYANGVQPIDELYDGFLIHSRGRTGAALGDAPEQAVPSPLTIRTDLDVPVLQFETETDLLRLGFLEARQPDGASVRTWEVAGTAHADQSTLDYGAESGAVWTTADADPAASCGTINDGPQAEVLRASLAALLTWIEDGTPPPTSPLIETTVDDIVTDANGNAVGGIRTPAVDAPISALSGKGNPSSVFCSLFGQRRDYDAAELAALYPDHDAYVTAVTASADAALDAGFLLEPERQAMVEDAEAAPIPS
jgi:hypothetical protein